MSNDYTRVAITEARDGDEVYQAGEWHRIDSVTPMAHSSNVHVRFTNGGTHNAPAHHFTARRAEPAHVCDMRTDGAGSEYQVTRDECPAEHPAEHPAAPTRYVIKSHTGFYIHALAPLTNPSWTADVRHAKTWAHRSSATAQAKRYQLNADVLAVRMSTNPTK